MLHHRSRAELLGRDLGRCLHPSNHQEAVRGSRRRPWCACWMVPEAAFHCSAGTVLTTMTNASGFLRTGWRYWVGSVCCVFSSESGHRRAPGPDAGCEATCDSGTTETSASGVCGTGETKKQLWRRRPRKRLLPRRCGKRRPGVSSGLRCTRQAVPSECRLLVNCGTSICHKSAPDRIAARLCAIKLSALPSTSGF